MITSELVKNLRVAHHNKFTGELVVIQHGASIASIFLEEGRLIHAEFTQLPGTGTYHGLEVLRALVRTSDISFRFTPTTEGVRAFVRTLEICDTDVLLNDLDGSAQMPSMNVRPTQLPLAGGFPTFEAKAGQEYNVWCNCIGQKTLSDIALIIGLYEFVIQHIALRLRKADLITWEEEVAPPSRNIKPEHPSPLGTSSSTPKQPRSKYR
jgi:hypothetical protein